MSQYPPQQPPNQHMQYPPQYDPPPQWPPEPPQKHTVSNFFIIGLSVFIVLLIGVNIIVFASNTGDRSTPTPTATTAAVSQVTVTQAPMSQPTAHPTPVPTQKPAAKPTPVHTFRTFGDGMFEVGKDIQPGTYRTRVSSIGCYYARLKAFDTNAIISNDNTDAPAVITILATDKAFQSQNCGTWTNDLSAITSNKTSFGDGVFIVGTDITPGTYRNSGSPGCYYARLSAFDTSAIISNDNTDAVAIVTIATSDKGFQSHNCGTWKQQ